MAGKVLKMNNMRKINNSAIMNKSAENPALRIAKPLCLIVGQITLQSLHTNLFCYFGDIFK